MKKIDNKKFEEFVKVSSKKGDEVFVWTTTGGLECLLITKKMEHSINAYIEVENKIVNVGSLVFGFENEDFNSIYLSSIAVLQEYHNQGIGKLMMNYFIENAKDYNFANIKVDSFKKLAGFFEQFGFEKSKQTSRVIVTMQKSLTKKVEKSL